VTTILIIDGVLQKESDSCGLWMHCEHLNRDPSDIYVCLMCKPPLLKYSHALSAQFASTCSTSLYVRNVISCEPFFKTGFSFVHGILYM